MADQQAELPAAPTGPEATVQFGEFECWLQARYPLEPDAGYHEWLKASCGDCQETGGIHKLSALSSNDVGWRHVSLATVLKKVLNYMEAKQWSGNMAPIQVFPLAGLKVKAMHYSDIRGKILEELELSQPELAGLDEAFTEGALDLFLSQPVDMGSFKTWPQVKSILNVRHATKRAIELQEAIEKKSRAAAALQGQEETAENLQKLMQSSLKLLHEGIREKLGETLATVTKAVTAKLAVQQQDTSPDMFLQFFDFALQSPSFHKAF